MLLRIEKKVNCNGKALPFRQLSTQEKSRVFFHLSVILSRLATVKCLYHPCDSISVTLTLKNDKIQSTIQVCCNCFTPIITYILHDSSIDFHPEPRQQCHFHQYN